MTAPEYKAFVDSETKKFAAIIERAKIKLEKLTALIVVGAGH